MSFRRKRSPHFALALLSLFLLTRPAPALPQEAQEPKIPSRITFEESDRFRLLVKELQVRTGGKVGLAKGIDNKEIKVALKDAGFYQVLDALCREHGEATYFSPEGRGMPREGLVVGPGAWVDYPASYHDHFKVAVDHMTRTRERSVLGEGVWVDVGIVLFAPPWIDVTFFSGADVTWSFEEARGPDGKDLLPKGGGSFAPGFIRVEDKSIRAGNLRDWSARLQDFEIAKGLKVLSGKATIKASESRIERVAAVAGKTLEIPGGRLTVDSVSEHEKGERGSVWRIGLTFKAKEGAPSKSADLDSMFERRVRYDGSEGDWRYQSWYSSGGSFEVKTRPIPRAPAWIELRVRGEERRTEVPFQFRDVVFKKEPR